MSAPKHKKKQPVAKASGRKGKPFGRWLRLNVVAGLIGLGVFTIVVNFNSSYHWLWFTYTHNNLVHFKEDASLTLRDRLVRRLGVDYSYVLTLRAMTPDNAVIYYPSRADFMADPPHGEKLPFQGTMVDKLAAVRVLYPRKVVMEDELGRTPYAEQLTHISVVNGLHRDMVSYKSDTTVTVDVLPTDPRYYVPY